jgi:pyridoxal phosphate enzyme (YggS family)
MGSKESEPASRLAAVRSEIERHARAAGRTPEEIRLVAVSKAQPAAAVRALYDLGVRDFGENYSQELASKADSPELRGLSDLGFAFIGTVQSNKIAQIVRHAGEIQSIASERHARLVAKAAAAAGKTPYPVWLLVNAGGEATKSGIPPEAAEALASLIQRDCPELRLEGVMAIPPPLGADSPAGAVPPLYGELRRLASRVGRGRLSLGMSGDLGLAIAAGSDCVRIGTALFGART